MKGKRPILPLSSRSIVVDKPRQQKPEHHTWISHSTNSQKAEWITHGHASFHRVQDSLSKKWCLPQLRQVFPHHLTSSTCQDGTHIYTQMLIFLVILDSLININLHHKLWTYSFLERMCLEMHSRIHALIIITICLKPGDSSVDKVFLLKNGDWIVLPRTHFKNPGVVVCACNHSAGEVRTWYPMTLTGHPA